MFKLQIQSRLLFLYRFSTVSFNVCQSVSYQCVARFAFIRCLLPKKRIRDSFRNRNLLPCAVGLKLVRANWPLSKYIVHSYLDIHLHTDLKKYQLQQHLDLGT